MKPSDVVKLAAALAAGTITAEMIESEHGHDVLGAVLGIGAGLGVASIVPKALDAIGISDFIDELF